MTLNDNVAIITGAASGIGKATSLVFAREGAKVLCADINAEGAEATARQIADTGGEKGRTYELLQVYEDCAAEMSFEWVQVESKDGPLKEYVETRSVPIPVHTEGAIGKRQCTVKWKIAPIEQYLHRRYGKGTPLIAQLITTGSSNRLTTRLLPAAGARPRRPRTRKH
ncbi:MAG: SDR family NAD(P)-dependent oxidoreductase [Chloroflexi bacterium]|nr:SDR family NAD(P)-dependent oxidoreductase [Chloroflexota bacterium]